MKTIFKIIFISLAMVIASCKNKDNDPSPKKNIEKIRIAPERPLQKTEEEYYLAIKYFKDYNGKDDVQLTVNNQQATLVTRFEGELEGSMILFKLPSNNQTGDANIKLSIDNGQEVVKQEQVLRFIDEYTLSSFWQNLDRDYWSESSESRRFRNGGFKVYQIGALPSYETDISLGLYYMTQKTYDDSVYVPFIKGLSGRYKVSFEGASLKELKVIHAEPLADSQYKPQQTYDEISQELGADLISTEEDRKGYIVNTYKKEDFTLKTYANERVVYTIITKE